MKSVFSFFYRHIMIGGILVLACGQATAMFMLPEPTPMNRLLNSAERFLQRHPDDPNAHYTLARIHYLAFHLRSTRMPAYRRDEKLDRAPDVAPQWLVFPEASDMPPAITSDKELLKHASLAIDEFYSTLKLAPTNALAQLGIASLEEEFLAWNAHKQIWQLPAALVGITQADIRSAYAKAMRLAMPEDSQIPNIPASSWDSVVSYEAAKALVRIDKDTNQALTSQEREELKQAESALKQFNSLPRGAVTPIVFSFRSIAHLDELLAPETTVDFDLRGFGPHDRWPWIKPQLGLLVWDPTHTGRVRSARQLFGGYTFEIFRDDGYAALAALDDNGDGVLSGDELDGISVWFDRNSDGIATPDEVVSVRDLGIARIAVTMDGHDGIHPTNANGITMRDGRTLRTWDWVVAPVSESMIAADQ